MRKRIFCGVSASCQTRLRACCVTQALSGAGVQPARCTRLEPISMKNRTIDRLQPDGFDGEEIAGQHLLSVMLEKGPPRTATALGSRRHVMAAQDVAHGGRIEVIA